MSYFILFFVAGFVLGFITHITLFRWAVRYDPENMINGIRAYYEAHANDDDDDFYEDTSVELVFEKINANKWHAYEKIAGTFISQGATKSDALDAAHERFPETIFTYEQ